MALQEAMFAMQITSDLLSHARLAREKNVSGTKILWSLFATQAELKENHNMQGHPTRI